MLANRHATLSASAVEQYVGCPWQFFARRSLHLKAPPVDAWERLNAMAQGRIAHRVFERHFRDSIPVLDAFEEAFEECCREERVPAGYRTEAVRLELLNAVQTLVNEAHLRPEGRQSLYEHPFTLLLDGMAVAGKIDRIDIDEQNRAVVFDYKYRRRERVRASIGENEDGSRVQGGLYLMAVEESGFQPAGFVYCGFRKQVSVAGWVLPPLRPELGSTCSEAHLADVMSTARTVALETAALIREGAIAPKPDDLDRCERCDYAAVCRFEVRHAGKEKAVGGRQSAE
jgi:ATP-dependent helicase/DNAse subunit B